MKVNFGPSDSIRTIEVRCEECGAEFEINKNDLKTKRYTSSYFVRCPFCSTYKWFACDFVIRKLKLSYREAREIDRRRTR